MRSQPSGYRDFGKYLGDQSFDAGVETVLGQMLRGLQRQNGAGLRPLFDGWSNARLSPAMVPVHIVLETANTAVFRLIVCLGNIEITRAFDKQLKGLPVDVRQAWDARVLPALKTDVRTAGNFKRLKGSHDVFSVRVHGPYRALLRQQGGDNWTVEKIKHRKEAY